MVFSSGAKRKYCSPALLRSPLTVMFTDKCLFNGPSAEISRNTLNLRKIMDFRVYVVAEKVWGFSITFKGAPLQLAL